MPAPPHTIARLQALRGAAVALVIGEHLALCQRLLAASSLPLASPGWLGVDLFFVISGFVIVRSLARDRFEPVAFLARRAFRLSPPLLVLVAIAWAVGAWAGAASAPGVVREHWAPAPEQMPGVGLSVVGGYSTFLPPPDGAILSVVWSLAVEDQFYAALTLACLAATLAFGRAAPRRLPGLLTAAAAGLFGGMLLLRLALLFIDAGLVVRVGALRYAMVYRLDLLALGVLLGMLDLRHSARLADWARRRSPWWAATAFLAPLTAATACGLGNVRLAHGLVVPCAGLGFGALVVWAAHAPGRGWGERALARLGDRSYGLYLFHTPAVLAALVLLGPSSAPSLGYWLLHALVAAAVLIPFVELIHRVVERPTTDLGRRLAKRVRLLPREERNDGPAPTPVVLGPVRVGDDAVGRRAGIITGEEVSFPGRGRE